MRFLQDVAGPLARVDCELARLPSAASVGPLRRSAAADVRR